METKIRLERNGQVLEIPIELSEEQVHQLVAMANKKPLTGWEAPTIGQMGYYENEYNEVEEFPVDETTIHFAQVLYENDNFFSTRKTAENTVRADNVCRRLRHYAISHRADASSMADGGYTITYNYEAEKLEIGATGSWLGIGDVVFDTEEIALQAMYKYADELTWYFTQGKTNM